MASAHATVARLTKTVPGLSASGKPVPSADGTATYFAATVTTPANSETAYDTAAVQPIRQAVRAAANRAHDGLHVAVTGSAAIVTDSGVTNKVQADLRLTALTIIVVILLLVYRRPFRWLFPLFGAIGAIVVAEAGAYGLANAGLTVSSLSASILIVLVLGAASDYALLLVHRYREELKHNAVSRGRDGSRPAPHVPDPDRLSGHGHLRHALPARSPVGIPARARPGRRHLDRLGAARADHVPARPPARLRPGRRFGRAPRARAGRDATSPVSGLQ